MILLFLAPIAGQGLLPLARFLASYSHLPWPWFGLFLGQRPDGALSLPAALLADNLFATIVVGGSVAVSVWAARQSLSGKIRAGDNAPRTTHAIRFGRDPLYRKELLWFTRDRSAIVQVVLIPLTLAGVQLFNFRGLLAEMHGDWNYPCGAAILFGTYFLAVLGPKSLVSEGSALWIALTWPRGIESLLKAKARLWSTISSAVVGVALCCIAYAYAASSWKIALVGIAWWFFARSMAEKAVTLATVTSSSGEPEKVPVGRRWATQLGTLTFAVGVFTARWSVAIVGVVYSMMTAAAMWQNFRARLPFLYDPWSEKPPKPPAIMHAMIAVSCLAESNAILMTFMAAVLGKEGAAVAVAISYGISAVIVSAATATFLEGRDVTLTDIWLWRNGLPKDRISLLLKKVLWVAAGTGLGLGLGAGALGYLALLRHVPSLADWASQPDPKILYVRVSYFFLAVLFAPLAEEYLFRGLLYRTLDREWGGWRAVLGSAAFFVIYHPPQAWLPVGALGCLNSLLFKRSGTLSASVAAHAAYNATLLL